MPSAVDARGVRPVASSALISVALTCVVGTITFTGAVTERALFGFVLPATLIGAAVAAWHVQRRLYRLAVGLGLAVVLAWSEVANVLTGQGNGPAARASAVAGACTLLALVVLASPVPALFLAAVAGMVLGAMLLGAGGEVRIVAVAVVLASVVTLAVVESSRRRWVPRSATNHRPREVSVVALSLLVAGAAVVTVLIQGKVDHRAPHAAVAGTSNSMVKPPWTDPLPSQAGTSATTQRATQARHGGGSAHSGTRGSVPPPPHRHRHHHHHHRRSIVPVLIALSILLLQGGLFARVVAVRRAWRATRERLRGSTPRAAVVGAWVWTRIRLAVSRSPLPAAMSPDVAARADLADTQVASVAEPLGQLAALVTPVAFSATSSVTEADAVLAWGLADEVSIYIEDALPQRTRIRHGFAMPPVIPIVVAPAEPIAAP